MKRMKQKGGISAGTWREYLILVAVMLPLTFCVSCGQTELSPVNEEDSSDISIAHIIEEEPEENSSEVTGIALPVESSALLYVNQRLGFTIEFPVEWAGLIQLEEEYDLPHQNGGNCITIYHRETLEKEGCGALFYIDCYPGVWAEDDRPVMAGASRRALQTENFAVFVRAPSGVEFSESDEELAARYQALSSQMEYLATHIKEIE